MQKKIQARKEKKIVVPSAKFKSDWFKCSSCGYSVRTLTLSNTITCSECGGTMYRV